MCSYVMYLLVLVHGTALDYIHTSMIHEITTSIC